MISNRYILGIVAFSMSFGISLMPNWDVNHAFLTGIITVVSTYGAALFTDNRRKNSEMLILRSLRQVIKQTEELKYRVVKEINQLQEHSNLLYIEHQKLQNTILDCRTQRDSLHRDVGIFAAQKKQLETENNDLIAQISTLEQSKSELDNSYSQLMAEKRRLELQCHTYRAEINQLHTQLSELHQQKEEVDSNLTLLNRLKPQLEEKMYDLRMEIQELEQQISQKHEYLTSRTDEQEYLETHMKLLQNQITEKQLELRQIQEQILSVQAERDLLQDQVWELLQQTDTLNSAGLTDNTSPEQEDWFPFAEIVAPIDKI